ncbi:MAG TPA: MMPL family transporter [Acidimicrobiales bacterium]|nr:MMPL family transporter [Acidimicrobiales bacterium]
MLNRLSSIALRAPRRVVAAWAIVFVLGLGAAGMLFSSLDADLDGASGFESERVAERLGELDPGGGEVVGIVDGAPVAPGVVDRLGGLEGVDAVHTLPSGDGRATAVVVELAGGLDDQEEEDAVEAASAELRAIDAPEVLVGGELLLDDEIAELAERDAQRAEMLSLPVALVVMAVVFGGVLAAGLPLAIALSGVGATMLGLTAVSSLTDVSLYAVNVTLMLGIGLGIDYGLLLLSRFREERGTGLEVAGAVRRTMATAGRTVVFSACTVAVALAGLLVFEDPTIRSLAFGGIGVVLATMLASLTLLPALLGRIGHRLRPQAAAGGEGGFARLARLIQRRSVPVVVVVGIGLVLLAAPLTHARFDDIGVNALPRSSETRQVAEAIDGRFPAVTAEPVEVVADVDPDDPALARWLDEVAALPAVAGATIDDASRAGVTVAEVRPEGASNGSAAQGVVRAVRGMDAPFPVAVGGDPAEIVDLRDSVVDRLPLAAAVLVTATFVLLFLMTGSVVVPIKAIVMNVLSLGATLGALVWVFQDGHLSGLLGFDPPGSLDLLMPVIVFVFAFGLSMDYEVFLLARIHEIWEETGNNDRAVAEGLQRSGRIVTSAALLIVIVFAGFATGEIVAMKQLGIGLAVAVIVDATVIRSLLVPATMKLMGRWNWWAPPALRWVHSRIGVRETPAIIEPAN